MINRLPSSILACLLLLSGCTFTRPLPTPADSSPSQPTALNPTERWHTGSGQTNQILLDSSGDWAAVGTSQGLHLYATADWQPRHTLSPDQPVLSMVFSPDGRLLAYVPSSSNEVVIWDMVRQREASRLPAAAAPIHHLAFTPTGDRLATASYDQIQLWQTDEPTAPGVRISPPDAGRIRTLAFADAGEQIMATLTTSTGNLFAAWDANTGQLIASQPATGDVLSATRTTSNAEWQVTWETNGRFQALRSATNTIEATIDTHTAGPITSLTFSPDGQTLAVGMGNGRVRFLQPASGAVLAELPDHAGGVDALAFAPDGQTLATGVGERVSSLAFDDTVRLWSWPQGELRHEFTGDKEDVAGCSAFQNQLAWTPNGRFLATASHDFTIELWAAADHELHHAFTGHKAPILDLAMAPDGTAVASASEDATLRIWPLDEDAPPLVLPSPAFGWQAVSYAPDGQTLVAATAAGEIVVWDSHSGAKRLQFSADLNLRSDLTVSPDGSLIAGASGATVHLWHAATGELAHVLPGATGPVSSIAFAPDGRGLAFGDRYGRVAFWQLAQE